MNESSNAPSSAELDLPPSQGAFPVWSKVYTRPGPATFLEITEHPDARAKSAYMWVFLVGTLASLINTLIVFFINRITLMRSMPDFEMPRLLAMGRLMFAFCWSPLAGLFTVIGFAAGAAIVHFTARFFGGRGNLDKMTYAFAAIAVPFQMSLVLLLPLQTIHPETFTTGRVILVLAAYPLFLSLAAVKAVHRFGWVEAASSTILPVVLIVLIYLLPLVLKMRGAGIPISIDQILQQLR